MYCLKFFIDGEYVFGFQVFVKNFLLGKKWGCFLVVVGIFLLFSFIVEDWMFIDNFEVL